KAHTGTIGDALHFVQVGRFELGNLAAEFAYQLVQPTGRKAEFIERAGINVCAAPHPARRLLAVLAAALIGGAMHLDQRKKYVVVHGFSSKAGSLALSHRPGLVWRLPRAAGCQIPMRDSRLRRYAPHR